MILRLYSLFYICICKLRYWDQFKVSNLFRIKVPISSKLIVQGKGTITIAGSLSLRENCKILANNGYIRIEDGVFMNRGCSINSHLTISLGKNVILGEYVVVYDHNHSISPINRKNNFTASPINIEDNVWVCSHSVVTSGVTIEKGSIIGPLNVVRKNVNVRTLYISPSEQETIR